MYVDLVMGINFLVDFLLLLGTNRLSGHPPGSGRAAMAAGIGGVYGGVCLLPGFAFLGGILWRCVSLVLMTLVAFGCGVGAVRRGILFCLLSMALGGIALCMGKSGVWGLFGAAGALYLLCATGFRGGVGKKYVPVTIFHKGRRVRITALVDTGNTLCDPVTGRSVLVIGPKAAAALTDLRPSQLEDPVNTMGQVPGLRLLPFQSVGKSNGLLLCLRVDSLRIGNREGPGLVGLCPEELGNGREYEALAGGMEC